MQVTIIKNFMAALTHRKKIRKALEKEILYKYYMRFMSLFQKDNNKTES